MTTRNTNKTPMDTRYRLGSALTTNCELRTTNSKDILLFDTTLRDGGQGEGIAFSLEDKLLIAKKLDWLGIDYIEGGYPLSNQKDQQFFEQMKSVELTRAKLGAFGMTRRVGGAAKSDKGLAALVAAETPVIILVGKCWDFQVTDVLRTKLEENLAMIRDSVAFCKAADREVIFDAEHAFDGYRGNGEYAMRCFAAAIEAGADWLCLCDTNGGSLPKQVAELVSRCVGDLGAKVAIHCHDDSNLGTAGSLAAVEAGATMVQGTFNGFGERCGNADLSAVIANLQLKMGRRCLADEDMQKLTEVSRYLFEMANLNPRNNQAFVGSSAFAHKGGMHVSAIQRDTRSYEHIDPAEIGNTRRILISELAGLSNVRDKAAKLNINSRGAMRRIINEVTRLESEGFLFESAEASFELLMRKIAGRYHAFFDLLYYRALVQTEGDDDSESVSEATVKLKVNDVTEHHVAEGDGPVNALDGALRKALRPHFPAVDEVSLVDYKVRVINARAATAAKVCVVVESRDKEGHWGTVGVSENIIDASWQALVDSIEYKLLKEEDKQSTV